jgi:hypothetical protein
MRQQASIDYIIALHALGAAAVPLVCPAAHSRRYVC